MSNSVKVKELEKSSDADVPSEPQTITVHIGQLGRKIKPVTVKAGTTLQEIVQTQGLRGTEIRLRGSQMPNNTVLRDEDLIISVPDAIVGGVSR